MRLIIRVLSVLGAVILIASSIAHYDIIVSYKAFLAQSVESTAEITSVNKSNKGYILNFSYTVNGKDIAGVYRTKNKDLAESKVLKIYYSKTNPEQIMLKRNYGSLLETTNLKTYRNLTIINIVGFCMLLVLYSPIWAYLVLGGRYVTATIVDLNTVKLSSGRTVTSFNTKTKGKPGAKLSVIITRDTSDFILFSKLECAVSLSLLMFLLGLFIYLIKGGYFV